MKVSYEDHDLVTVLTMSGDFLADQQDMFRRTCDERIHAGIRDFVLNLEHLAHIDSIGLEMLLWLQKEVTGNSGRLRIAMADDLLHEVLMLTRLTSKFDLFETVEAAAKSLR